LLPEPERLVMRRLAIFVGDFTAEAASLVAAGGEIAASEVVRSLANLVTKSLVALDAVSVITHYRLHETTRAYALEKLRESGELGDVARRHADYYRDLSGASRSGGGNIARARVADGLRPSDRPGSRGFGLGLLADRLCSTAARALSTSATARASASR